MMKNSKRIIKLLMLCLALTLAAAAEMPFASAGESYIESGSRSIAKLGKAEIAELLKSTENRLGSDVFELAPSLSSPYSTGSVRASALDALAARLNAMRRIAGLPSAALDSGLCLSAQYGAVLNAANETISHTPSKPADMDELFYNLGAEADSTCNLYWGSGTDYISSITSFMDDSDSVNIDRLGHRRWQLNTSLGRVGFGLAESSSGSIFLNEKVFDRSGVAGDYDFIAWPSSGYFPSELFKPETAWSVSLNPDKYQSPVLSAVTVSLSLPDGRSLSFAASDKTSAPSPSSKYFNIDLNAYGLPNAIIFRPPSAEIGSYSGVYTVDISGLKYSDGSAAELSYRVEFFDEADEAAAAAEDAEVQAEPVKYTLSDFARAVRKVYRRLGGR